MKRIGLLGGSFDPVHLAHVALAQSALSALALEQVQLIPTANPWQREALQATRRSASTCWRWPSRTSPAGRQPHRDRAGGATYTIDTLRALPGDARYVWLLGADQLANFCTGAPGTKSPSAWTWPWRSVPARRWRRPPNWRRLRELGRGLQSLPFAPMAVSASEIRRRGQGESTAGMLAEPVAAYIAAHNLYR